jgi:predicted O-linked N-acetylglucosamine transferase (SPINDLY family)
MAVSAHVSGKIQQALAYHQQGDLARAQSLYEDILKVQPRHFDALHMLGVMAGQRGDFEKAADLIGGAIEVNPHNAAAHCNRGAALNELRRLDAALASYNHAIAIKADYAVAHYSRGNVLKELARLDAALASFDRAIAIKPDYTEAHNDRGLVLQELKRFESALESYEKAILFKLDHAQAHCNRGTALRELRRFDAALASYGHAIAIKPDCAEAYSNRGVLYNELRQFAAAIADYDRAIAIRPDYAEAYVNRGYALQQLEEFAAAILSFDVAIALKPDLRGVYSTRLFAGMQICDWGGFEENVDRLKAKIRCGEAVAHPFAVMALSGSPSFQRQATEAWVRGEFPRSHAPAAIPGRADHGKIRVGYFSADFRDHPVSTLTAEMIETHDRSRLEVTGFSFGPDTQDEMRKRMQGAFDRFIDVREKSDADIAMLARQMEIDIAVDLGGFTHGARPAVFALRAAPLQVSYIGYLGTMGADFMDYLIADATIVPRQEQQHYSEKIIYLPSYQANDSKRCIAEEVFTREALGLPAGFVFCCFNQSYKIAPETFDAWMRILARVAGSVLYLYSEGEAVEKNLRKEAGRRGVDAGRLVFGRRLPPAENLARYRAADLFLDTLPYNAGATASDALWAGLPVLTRVGASFAGRVAASLLTALELPELITGTQQEYEDLAVELATHPGLLDNIKRKLTENRRTTALFDARLFVKHLEAAYTTIYRRYLANAPTDHVHVRFDQARGS